MASPAPGERLARRCTIHDFFGFPKPLFDVEYAADGSLELAQEVAEVAKPDWVGLDQHVSR